MYIRSRIFNNLIAGYLGLIGLCQWQLFCMQLTKAYEAKMSCNQVAINSAMYVHAQSVHV